MTNTRASFLMDKNTFPVAETLDLCDWAAKIVS